MKKILYFVLLLLLCACGQSQVQKAESLIKQSLKKTLYKPETYKPVETKLDSAFAPYDDPSFYDEIAKLGEMNSDYEELEEKAKQAKTTMALWSGPYQTAFGKIHYQDAKDEYDETNAQMEKVEAKALKQLEKVRAILQEGRKFIGYKAIHNYRADNNMGNTLIGNEVFFIDKDLTEVIFTLDVDEYNQIQKAMSQLKEQIEESEE